MSYLVTSAIFDLRTDVGEARLTGTRTGSVNWFPGV